MHSRRGTFQKGYIPEGVHSRRGTSRRGTFQKGYIPEEQQHQHKHLQLLPYKQTSLEACMPERRESERGVKNKSVRDRGEGEDRQGGGGGGEG